MTERIAFAGTVTREGRRLKGSVLLAGQRTYRNGEWVQVDPAALVKADASKAFASMEHDDARLLAAASNGSLRIIRHDKGFDYETDELPNTTYANDALELVDRGLVGGSSFEITGLRSEFSTDPDGTRVRTYTGIKTFLSVSPVRDPAFPSMAAAFSEEPNVTDTIVQPETPAAPPAPPVVAAPPPQDDKSEFYRRAEAFAKDQPLASLAEQMGNLVTADMSEAAQEQYSAFAAVYEERKRNDRETRERFERIQRQRDMLLGRGPKAPEAGLFASEDYRQAFTAYLRTGERVHMEQFAQSIAGDGTQGGYAVPDGFLNRITESMASFGGIAGIADSITTSDGQPLRWPSNNDTGNSAVIASEGAAAGSAGADLIFGSVTLGAFSYDATGASNLPLLVSKELLQDAAFDIEGFIGRKLGERLRRKMAADFATGSGSGQPKGLLDKTPDSLSATTLYAALVEHHFQVNSAYREQGNCRWVLSDTTLAKAYNSLDDNGRPLYIPQADSSGAGRPGGLLLGYPVTLDQGAGNLVAFGDIRAGYIIRNVRGIQVDVDPYTNIKTRQLAFHAWARADANIQDSAAYSVSDYTSVTADS